MVERRIMLSFLTASALALGIDPAVAKRIAEDRIEYPRPRHTGSAAGRFRRYRSELKMKIPRIARISQQLLKLAPYYAVALLVPGGSLLAIVVWFYQNRRARALT